jgi:hypothetical protein
LRHVALLKHLKEESPNAGCVPELV